MNADDFQAELELGRYGLEQLGERQWALLKWKGKLFTGPPYGGLYVSGIPTEMARAFIDVLIAGQTIPVHLMHKHRSGNYEVSSLRMDGGRFVMVFEDREEFA